MPIESMGSTLALRNFVFAGIEQRKRDVMSIRGASFRLRTDRTAGWLAVAIAAFRRGRAVVVWVAAAIGLAASGALSIGQEAAWDVTRRLEGDQSVGEASGDGGGMEAVAQGSTGLGATAAEGSGDGEGAWVGDWGAAVGEGLEGGDAGSPFGGSRVGYDNGFFVANHGSGKIAGREFPFFMRINGWTQLRHTLFNSTDNLHDQNLFSIERLRLGMAGHMYTPDLRYSVLLDSNTDRPVNVAFLDALAIYDIGSSVMGWDEDRWTVRAGKWKVPFSRARAESARKLEFVERSPTDLFFDIGRATGIGLDTTGEALGGPIGFATALFNGFNTGNDSTSPGEDFDNRLAWSARVHADPLGAFGDDGEPDLDFRDSPVLRLGAGAAVTRVSRDGQGEFQRQRVIDSGLRLSDLLPAAVDAYDIAFYTLDAHWKYRGFSLIAESSWRGIDGFRGAAVPGLVDHGVLLQTGYFVVPKRLETIWRWSEIVGDSGTLGDGDRNTNELAAGLAWYIRGHDVKFVCDVSRIHGTPVSSNVLSLLPGDDGWLVRSQFQVGF
jgi:hypothetical protein